MSGFNISDEGTASGASLTDEQMIRRWTVDITVERALAPDILDATCMLVSKMKRNEFKTTSRVKQ